MAALTRMRILQMQAPSLDADVMVEDGPNRPCQIDRLRAACEIDHKGDESQFVSASVARRRDLGRQMRSAVYSRMLGQENRHCYAASFADLVEHPGRKLPPSLRGKMAVVHMDGNAFTCRREKAIQQAEVPHEVEALFSKTVDGARSRMMATLLDRFREHPAMYIERSKAGVSEERLRFETLLWGGDEAVLVFPAWVAWESIGYFAETMEDTSWVFEGKPLTQAMGILICNYKMPIAAARALAEGVMEEAKSVAKSDCPGAPKNALAIQVVQGIEPAFGQITDYRSRRYGTSDAKGFSLTGREDILRFQKLGYLLTAPDRGFPRSQLYQVLRDADSARCEADDGSWAVEEGIKRALQRREAAGDPGNGRATEGRVLKRSVRRYFQSPGTGGSTSA